jgi:hypothetical protein
MLFGLSVYSRWPVVLGAMVGTGSILLAWHYTGQAWGMMASFGFIEGFRFTNLERRLIRTNLYTLLAWHVMWAIVVARNMFDPQAVIEPYVLTPGIVHSLYRFVTILAMASSVFGIAGLALQIKRTGRRPTLRMVLPWVAVHLWYVLLYREPAAIFWAQNAHALQYLIFPMRVEMNRLEHKGRRQVSIFSGPMIRFYAATVVLGLIVMQLIPEGTQIGLQRYGVGLFPIQLVVVAFINVHHYFIDNFIWKIRNPIVRDNLFSHLQAPQHSPAVRASSAARGGRA